MPDPRVLLVSTTQRMRAEHGTPHMLDPRKLSAPCVHIEPLDASELAAFSGGVLWPALHYLIDRVPIRPEGWDQYVAANERLAEVIAREAREDDRIWIHDYPLMLLPALVRARLPRARIGFFLHTPFPSAEVFSVVPHDEQLLAGLLGADLIGFQTFAHARHFTTALLRKLGVEVEVDRLCYEGRRIHIGAFPMAIDAATWTALGENPEIVQEAQALRRRNGDAKLLLGVERLDYTRGLLRRLLAVDLLLEREPRLRDALRLLQVAVAPEEADDEYRRFKKQAEELVEKINRRHGGPIQLMTRAPVPRELAAMYRAADVMLATPLREGMNLPSKEFVATRADGDGVLVLSELSGSVWELGEAVIVNPYDVQGLAETLSRALAMPEAERRKRMASMRRRILGRSTSDWSEGFLAALSSRPKPEPTIDLHERPIERTALVQRVADAPRLTLLLDYDGTLVPIVKRPDLAAPDDALRRLLTDLASLPSTTVHVVTGRRWDVCEAWLGDLPVMLHAEHGLWSRPGHGVWKQNAEVPRDWMERARAIMEDYAARTPGAQVEGKSAGIAWHYREADPELGALQARELRHHLVQALAQQPVTVIAGDKVVEIRPAVATKALAVNVALALKTPGTAVVAIGDDRTDEDMFAALPEGGFGVAVGPSPSHATHRLDTPQEVRAMLLDLIARRRARS